MKTGLVIEDSDDNMELITFILERHGYGTLRAETGRKGIRLALQVHPDFIILDIDLPDMNGKEVLHQLKQSANLAQIPVIVMTSHAMAGDRQRLMSAGCAEYIEKPIDPELVVKQIQKVVESV